MSQGKLHTFASLREDVDFIEIPIIQRDYAQGRGQAADVRKAFLDALRNALLPDAAALDLDFIYGNVTTDGVRHLSVLDGQQRLTTLFLLHWYLAARDGQLDDFRRRWVTPGDARSRFSYATRPSATEFFQALARSEMVLPIGSGAHLLSKSLIDAKWFFDTWRRDPTVNSCLVMLDAIHDSFRSEGPGKYLALVEGRQVTFNFLNLREFGLSDDLYIKMNARGKPLTPFENFKAWLIERAGAEPWSDEFALGMDQRWLDFFWDLSGRSGAVQPSAAEQTDYDELFLRFFYVHAFFETCLTIYDQHRIADTSGRIWLTQLRSARGYMPLSGFNNQGVLRQSELSGIMKVLDFLSSKANSAFRATLLNALSPKAGYEELLQLYALSAFIRSPSIETLGDEERKRCLHRWLRVTSNLIRNSRIEDQFTAASVIIGLTELAARAADLYEALAESAPTQRGFSRDQALEESRKASLVLQDPEWESLLEKAEGHWYLQGRIDFLLELAAVQSSGVDKERFGRYAAAMQRVITRQMLDSPNYVLQRALLCLYDYVPSAGGGNHTFCISNATSYRDRLENWLAVFQDPRFGALLDAVGEDGPASLERLIAACNVSGWRRQVVTHPELIAYCGMRLLRKQGHELLLLSKSRLTGYFAEAHSLALFYELSKRRAAGSLTDTNDIQYKYVYGEEWPGVRVRIDQYYLLGYRNGAWQCTDDDGVSAPIPPALAAVLPEASVEPACDAG